MGSFLSKGLNELTVALAVFGVLTEADELFADYLDTVGLFFLFFNTQCLRSCVTQDLLLLRLSKCYQSSSMLLVVPLLFAVRALGLLRLLRILADENHLVVKGCFLRMGLRNQKWGPLSYLSVSYSKETVDRDGAHHAIHLQVRMIGKSSLAFLHLPVELTQIFVGA